MNEEQKQQENKDRELTHEEWINLLTDVFAKKHIPFLPTERAINGITFDFCSGVRVLFPPSLGGRWGIEIYDMDSEIVIQKAEVGAGDYFVSRKRYFVNYGIRLYNETGKLVWQYKLNLKGKKVFLRFPVETLGDTIAWFKSVELFIEKHECEAYIRIADYIRPLLEPCHPNMKFITNEEAEEIPFFAQYTLAIFHNDKDRDDTVADYRTVPLHHCSSYILGVPISEEPPKITISDTCKIPEKPYVAIGAQASGGAKLWHNPTGWERVVGFLKSKMYSVYDIDRDYMSGNSFFWNKIPSNAAEMTGNISLPERARMLKNADFFIGLGSGLSWLAWACGIPVVLISGFSEPWEEFKTPYRINNPHVCHGCFNSVEFVFDHKDYFWCPKHKMTKRHWECSMAITPASVIKVIETIPVFKERISEILKQQQTQIER